MIYHNIGNATEVSKIIINSLGFYISNIVLFCDFNSILNLKSYIVLVLEIFCDIQSSPSDATRSCSHLCCTKH